MIAIFVTKHFHARQAATRVDVPDTRPEIVIVERLGPWLAIKAFSTGSNLNLP